MTFYIPWEGQCLHEVLEVPWASFCTALASLKHWPSPVGYRGYYTGLTMATGWLSVGYIHN